MMRKRPALRTRVPRGVIKQQSVLRRTRPDPARVRCRKCRGCRKCRLSLGPARFSDPSVCVFYTGYTSYTAYIAAQHRREERVEAVREGRGPHVAGGGQQFGGSAGMRDPAQAHSGERPVRLEKRLNHGLVFLGFARARRVNQSTAWPDGLRADREDAPLDLGQTQEIAFYSRPFQVGIP